MVRQAAVGNATAASHLMLVMVAAFGATALVSTMLATVWALRSEGRMRAASDASERRLKLLVEHAPAAIAMFDKDMRYLATNARYVLDYGLNAAAGAEALIGRSHYDVFPKMPERWRDVHRRVLAGEALAENNEPFARADGSIDWVNWDMVPWRQSDGSVGGTILSSEVVTARRQASWRQAFLLTLTDRLQAAPRAAMAATVELLGNHFKVSRAGYGEVNATGELATVVHEYNDGTVASAVGEHRLPAFGHGMLDDLRAGRTVAIVDVLADPRTQAASAAHLAIGTRALLVVPMVADGCLQATLYLSHHDPRRWTEDEVQVAEAAAGRTWSQVEQARAKDALDSTLEEFRTLADGIPTLCWMAKPDGRIYWFNQRWFDYTGTQAAEMEGEGWQSVHDPAVLPAVLERWHRSIAAGTSFEMTFPLRRTEGVFRPFMTRVAPVRDANGQVRRWLGVNSDVTEAAEREAALVQAAAALRVSEGRLRVIFDTAPVGIIIAEAPTGQLVAANQQTEVIFRHPMLHSPDVRRYQDWVSFHPDGRRVAAEEYPLGGHWLARTGRSWRCCTSVATAPADGCAWSPPRLGMATRSLARSSWRSTSTARPGRWNRCPRRAGTSKSE